MEIKVTILCMYLEIDKKSYFIHLKANIDGIQLKKIEGDLVHLDVPVLMPQENLISYIKNEFTNHTVNHKKSYIFDYEPIKVFDKLYPIRIKDIETPYLMQEVVYANTRHVISKVKLELLKQQLLLNHINNILSMLEEELNVILPVINLKKLKTKFYAICPTIQIITYSKILIEKSLDFVNYVIIITVGNFLKFSDDQIYYLLKKHVSNWKHCERIFHYEQQ